MAISPSSSISASPSLGYELYTRDSLHVLPSNDNDLSVLYTAQEVQKTTYESNKIPDLENDVEQEGALEYLIHQFKTFVGNLTSCGVDLSAESTLDTSLSPVYLQIYNHTTNVWDTLCSNTNTPANITFNLFTEYIDLTNYKNSEEIISVRIYQLGI